MQNINALMKLLSRLPGLGPRSARRMALYMLQRKEGLMIPLAQSLQNVAQETLFCDICGNLDDCNPCHICRDGRRAIKAICVVEQVGDLWALERSKAWGGRYHVLGGVLSALDGVGPEDLNLGSLLTRVQDEDIKEVILATNMTVEGQTTAHYISDRLDETDVVLTQLAHGVPIGGELDYMDDGTLKAALAARK